MHGSIWSRSAVAGTSSQRRFAALALCASALFGQGCARDLDVPGGAGYLTGRAIEAVPGTTEVRALAGANVQIPNTNLGAVADAQGLFTVGPLPTGQYRLLITATSSSGAVRQRLVAAQQVLNGATRPLGDLLLEENARLSGRALLQGQTSGNAGITIYLPDLDIPATATADNGAWSLPALPGGTVRAAAWRPGYQVATTPDLLLQGGVVTAAVDLTLVPEVAQPQPGSISGVVRVLGAADGSGVSVTVATSTPADPGAEGAPVKSVTTAASGAFKLDGLAPGLYTLRATVTGLPAARVANLAVGAGASVVLADIILAQGQTHATGPAAPAISAPAQVVAAQGVPVSFTVTASAAGAAVAIAFQGAHPAGATLVDAGNGTAKFTWTPDAAAATAGGVDIGFTATAQGLVASASTHVDVYPGPDLAVVGPAHLSGGQAFDLALSASSRFPGASWTLSATGTPAGATFNDQGSGAASFHWSTSVAVSGSFPVTFTASDGLSSVKKTVTLVVDRFNVAPVMAGPLPSRIVTVGATATVDLSATDANLDPLTFTVSPAGHAGAALTDHHDGTATFTFAPLAADASTVQYFSFSASDGSLAAQQTLQITVPSLGNVPVIHAPVRLSGTAGTQVAFTITASVAGGVPALTIQGAHPAAVALHDNGDGTADFTWTPDAAAAALGGVDLVFAATATGATATAGTRIDVYPALNQPPALVVTGALDVDETQTLKLSLTATDPQSSPVSLFVTGAPANSALADAGNGTGTFTFTPRIGQAGLYPVSFLASNGKSVTTVAKVINVHATTAYVAPTLLVLGNTHIAGGQSFDLVVAASDLDATKKLVLSATGTPAGATFTDLGGGSASFHWATGLPNHGAYAVTFAVSDGVTVVSQAVALTVDKFNVAPVLQGPLTDRVVSVGGTLTVVLTATDANLDALAYTMTPSAHAGAALADHGDGTATFTFSPLAADASTVQQFVFFVSDGALGAQQTLKVTVPAAGNQAPIWTAVTGTLSVAEGGTLAINLSATDPNSDPITLGQSQMPSYASLKDNGDGTGVLTLTPGYGVVSSGTSATATIGLVASDNHGGVTPLSLTVTISDVPRTPVITHHADVVLGETASTPVVIAATEPDGKALTYTFSVSPGGLTTSASGSTLTVTAPAGSAGAYAISVKVSNGFLSQTDTVNLTVAPRPVLTVTTSGNGALSSSPAGISCNANAGTCAATFLYGASVVLTETPNGAAQFGGWQGACTGTATTCSLTLTSSTSTTATFGTYYTLGLTVTGSGTISADSGALAGCAAAGGVCSASYAANLNVLLTAAPAAGYQVNSWGGACAGATGNTCTVAMSAAKTATVWLAPITTLAQVSGDQQTALAGALLPQPVVIAISSSATSTGAPPTLNLPVTLTGPAGAVITPATAVVDGNGKATFSVRLAPTPGAQAFSATMPTGANSLPITATATTPAPGVISALVNVDHTTGFTGVPGPGAAAHVASPSGMVLAQDGTLFFADSVNNRVFAQTAGGALSVVAGTGACTHTGDFGPAAAATLCGPLDVALDETHGRRTLFVTDTNLVRAIDLLANPPQIATFAGGGTATTAPFGDKGAATSATLNAPAHLAVPAAGDYLYVVDNGNDRIRRVTLGAVNTIDTWLLAPANTVFNTRYNGCYTISNDCTVAFDAQQTPYVTMAVGNWPPGPSCVTPPNRGSVLRVSADGATTTLVAGGGTNSTDGAPAVGALLGPRLTSLAFDAAGNLYIADRVSNVVKRVEAGVGRIATIAGTGVAGYAGDFGDSRAAQLNNPTSVVVAPNASLLVSDTLNSAVRAVWSETATTTSYATLSIKSGSSQSATVDVPASAPLTVLLLDPQGQPLVGYPISWSVVDPGGALFLTVATTNNQGLAAAYGIPGLTVGASYRFSATYSTANGPVPSSPQTFSVTALAPAGGSFFSAVNADHTLGADGFGGGATRAHINGPTGAAAAKDGTVYFADFGNNQVYALSAAGQLAVVAGTGTAGHTGDAGPAKAATLTGPYDVALDETNGRRTLYVIDGNLIRAIDLTQANPPISTFAGGGSATATSNYGDGLSATFATLTTPLHLAVSPLGDWLYIVDNGISRVRRVALSGANAGVISAWFSMPANTICTTIYNGCTTTNNDCAIAFDGQQNAYVSMAVGNDPSSCVALPNKGGIYRVSADGLTTTLVAGFGTNAAEGVAAIGAAMDTRVTAFAFDAAGNLYLNERYNHRIRKVTGPGVAGATISTVIGTGTAGTGADWLAPLSTALNFPWSFGFTVDGKLVVADTNNHTVRIVWPPF